MNKSNGRGSVYSNNIFHLSTSAGRNLSSFFFLHALLSIAGVRQQPLPPVRANNKLRRGRRRRGRWGIDGATAPAMAAAAEQCVATAQMTAGMTCRTSTGNTAHSSITAIAGRRKRGGRASSRSSSGRARGREEEKIVNSIPLLTPKWRDARRGAAAPPEAGGGAPRARAEGCRGVMRMLLLEVVRSAHIDSGYRRSKEKIRGRVGA